MPYYFVQGAGGAIGFIHPEKPTTVCGGLAHIDDKSNMLWWNSGLQSNKKTSKTSFYNFTHYAIYNRPASSWHLTADPACASGLNNDEIHELKPFEINLHKNMVSLYMDINLELGE